MYDRVNTHFLKNNRGDLGLTVAIILLITLLIGSFVGIQVLKKPQLPSKAYQTGDCGTVCAQPSDCKDIDTQQGIALTCEEAYGRCVPAEGQPQCNFEGRSTGFGLCGALCTSNTMCDNDLRCDLSTPTSQTYRTCIPANSYTDCDGTKIIHLTPTITPTPTIAQTSCFFNPVNYVKLKLDDGSLRNINVQIEPDITKWTTQNDRSPQTPQHFGVNGTTSYEQIDYKDRTYCCGIDNTNAGYTANPKKTYLIDKESPFDNGDHASVTLTNIITTRNAQYTIVEKCNHLGICENVNTGDINANTIDNLPVGCLSYQYGWILTCVGNDCFGYSPTPTMTMTPTPTATSSPTPTPTATITVTPTPTSTTPTVTPTATITVTPTPSRATSTPPAPTVNPAILCRPTDINTDGYTNSIDFAYVIKRYRTTTNIVRADLNCDGKVNAYDISLLIRAFR